MGCKVKVNRHGYLAFRLIGHGIPGGRTWEGSPYKDTPENRKLAEAKALLIAEQMKAGNFDYLSWFPHGNRAGYFEQQQATPKAAKTLRQYFDQWILRKTPPLVRKSLARDYRQHFNAYILPKLGASYLAFLKADQVEGFRNYLLHERGVKVKTARNIIGGSLRALLRDARGVDGLIDIDPCANIQWPRLATPPADPFTEDERDAIIAYFYRKKRWTYPFVLFQFWTGCRPSETTALRWGDVDLRSARAQITKSRHLGEDAATKTRASERTLNLFDGVAEVLRAIQPIGVDEKAHVFLNRVGKAVDAGDWQRKHWNLALRACKIRPRTFYHTRHTFISIGLSYNVNIKMLAESTGTSVTMIERNYGKWMDLGKVKPQVKPSRSQNQKSRNIAGLAWWSQRDHLPVAGLVNYRDLSHRNRKTSSDKSEPVEESPPASKYRKIRGGKR